MKKNLLSITTAILLLIFFSVNGFAKGNPGSKKQQKTLSTYNSNTYIDINNLEALESNQGFSDYNTNSNLEGMQFPKGSGKSVFFETGLLWGGYVSGDNQVRVGGSSYTTGLEPGPILSNGQAAANPNTDSRWRIYRVRPDVYPGGPTVDLTNDANIEGTTATALRTQYETDWTEWPAAGTSNDLGAPFTDVNGDGIYEPNIDIPGISGADQTVYYVANDLDPSLTNGLYGTQPMGIELHATYWAYNQWSTAGNMYFKKYTLINKGYQKNTIDSMFISLWADPDLGYAGDDLVGTDSTLNLIYTYNGEPIDQVYAPATPPCVGMSLLEGPMVNGNITDTALYNGNKIGGKKNLPMTASYFFVNGDAHFGDPPIAQPSGSTQLYNFFNGEYGLTGQRFNSPYTLSPTNYVFTGDPVAGTGWLDGVALPPGDRRQGMASGPFTFAPGDTQEVVFAEIVGDGLDYLHSVYSVKVNSYNAVLAFHNMMQGIKSPSPSTPFVTVTNNNDSVQIQWENNAEEFNKSGYSFEGYNVYQSSSNLPSKENTKLIATYDLKDGVKSIFGEGLNPSTDQLYFPQQQFGVDNGLQYNFTATKDYINNAPFIKGMNYYYSVTSYSYNPALNANPNNTESNFQPHTIAYNYNLPGPNYGDSIKVTHIAGQATGGVTVVITDPSKLTGDNYSVTIDTLQGGAEVWNLKDVSKNIVLFSNEALSAYNTSQKENIDGFQITVTNPQAGMKDWSIPQGTRRFTWAGNSAVSAYGLEGFSGAIGWASPDFIYVSGVESVPANQLHNTLLTLAQVTDTSLFNPTFPSNSDVNLSYGYRYLRHASSAAADPRFASHIINTTGGTYPFQDFAQTVPLSAWNIDDPAHPLRLVVGYLENNVVGGLVDGKYWPPDYTQLDNAITREFLWIFNAPYSTSPNPAFEEDALTTSPGKPLPIMWFSLASRRGPVPFSPDGTGEDQLLIIKSSPLELNDVFTFNSSILTEIKSNKVVSKYSLNQNYPNPFNPTTTIEFSIPNAEKVTLKVYDILGKQIASLVNEEKPAGSYSVQFNASRLASGVYFYRIEAGKFLQTKKLILLK